MPIQPPALDDRSFADLVDEMLARIPAHAPEYTNPRLGDPGRTLIELFAYMADAILYRANLVPERQRLAFLRLLGEPLRPAQAARGVVSLRFDDEKTEAVTLAPLCRIKGPVPFETRSEVTVVPVSAEGFYKRRLTPAEATQIEPLRGKLEQLYGLSASTPYVTTAMFANGLSQPGGFDLVRETIDGSLWLALLAPTKAAVEAARTALGKGADGRQTLFSVGVVPALEVPALSTQIGPRARIPHEWEVATGKVAADGAPEYVVCEEVADSTAGFTRRGVVRLVLPAASRLGALPNDVRTDLKAGTEDRPPRLDNAKQAERLVTWLRLRPRDKSVTRLALSWIGINAVEIDQRITITGRVVGQSNGAADQVLRLPGSSLERETLVLQVDEPGRGYQPWTSVDDVALAGRDDGVYVLDAEAGTVRFGDGVRGRVPPAGQRVRVAVMRAGGGAQGNLPAATLTDIEGAVDLDNEQVDRKIKVVQAVATEGGTDSEGLAAAEQRIPQLLRNRDRAVTAEDFRVLAAATPGVSVGRVEVLPGFKPQQRRPGTPGVVAVMALPQQGFGPPPNPRPDRPFLEAISGHLDARRLVTSEVYVIGCEYVPLGLSVGVSLRETVNRDQTLNAIKLGLRRFLWPLLGGGMDGGGWPRGRAVRDREIEVAVAQVPGVQAIQGVNVFQRQGDDWARILPQHYNQHETRAELRLEEWQLPELLSVVVVADADPPGDLRGVPNPFATGGVAVPVVPEVC